MIEKKLDEYFDRFGLPYPLTIGCGTEEEVIKDIDRCIKSGIPAKEPEFDDDVDY